jgi:AcrR family transcriptional regulator
VATPSTRRRGPETRDALVAAGLALLERDGIDSLTTRRIAEEAGLPLGAVHYWFADKDELLGVVVDTLLADVRSEVAAASAAALPGDRLDSAFRGFSALPSGRQLALFELTTHAIRTPGLREQARRQYASYRGAAREGLSPWIDDADRSLPGGAAALASLIVAVIDGVTLAQLADEDAGGSAALTLFAHLLALAGIGALDSTPPASAAE